MFPIPRPVPALRRLALGLVGLIATAVTAAADYRVASGDVLDVTVFRVPELSRQLTVDVTGRVAFPPLGAIAVDGATLDEIGMRIRAALQEQGILTDAQVTVGLALARPVIVGGDVTAPNDFAYRAGLTVRRAIAMAGGVGLSRIRGMEEIAELRSQREVLALDLTQTLARAARLAAEMEGQGDAVLAIPGPQLVSPAQRDAILAAETRQLTANLQETAANKALLITRRAIVEDQVANLTVQTEQQKSIIGQQIQEVAKMQGLKDDGLASNTRVLDEQRALENAQERAADTAAELARAKDSQAVLKHEVDRFDDDRRANLDAAIADARQAAETARARLAGVTERLAQLGMADATDVSVVVYRRGPEGDIAVPATQDTLLQPGDMVEVTIDLSRLAGAPLALQSSN